MHILIDMDDVLTPWSPSFKSTIVADYPRLRFPFVENESYGWDLHAGLGPRGIRAVENTMSKPGFYAELPVMEGAVEAVHDMLDKGHDVTICSTPWVSNPTCASDKLNWMERHFGKGWGARTILTPDKTMIIGDVLIDDKPKIKGRYKPGWSQVLFDAPHNQDADIPVRMFRWDEWEDRVWDALSALEESSRQGRTPSRTTS